MKTDRAIEILTAYGTDYLKRLEPDFDDAVKLGVQALKQLEALKKLPYGSPLPPLPSETTEDEPERR